MRYLVLVFVMLFSHLGFTKVTNIETNSFKVIKSTYEHQANDPNKTLLVFDIDDTLLTMTQPLGSVAWWDWQYHLLKTDKDNPMLFTKDPKKLMRIMNILFQLEHMEVTDEGVLPLIHESISQGATVMGLTARGIEHENATENQLKWNHFTDKDELIFKLKGVKLRNNKTSQAGGLTCEPLTRYVGYEEGVMYLAGQNKGEALKCLLNQSKKKYKTVLFVDDTKENLNAMQKVFEHDPTMNLYNIYFTKEHPKEEKFLNSPKLQKEAYLQWTKIKKALEENIKDSVF